jgi:hypothetical protein
MPYFTVGGTIQVTTLDNCSRFYQGGNAMTTYWTKEALEGKGHERDIQIYIDCMAWHI